MRSRYILSASHEHPGRPPTHEAPYTIPVCSVSLVDALFVAKGRCYARSATARWQRRLLYLRSLLWSVGLPQVALFGCFAMLHHFPRPLQLPFLQQLRRVAVPNAAAIISVWQFAHLQRFLNKRVDWATVGIANAELTEQDYLLDWRQGGIGLRYVYHFKDAELVALCEQAGWQVLSQFRSDGASHDLGLYTLLRAD